MKQKLGDAGERAGTMQSMKSASTGNASQKKAAKTPPMQNGTQSPTETARETSFDI